MLLIPLPLSASRGDQILNAESFEKRGYAIVLREEKITPSTFLSAISYLEKDKQKMIARHGVRAKYERGQRDRGNHCRADPMFTEAIDGSVFSFETDPAVFSPEKSTPGDARHAFRSRLAPGDKFWIWGADTASSEFGPRKRRDRKTWSCAIFYRRRSHCQKKMPCETDSMRSKSYKATASNGSKRTISRSF